MAHGCPHDQARSFAARQENALSPSDIHRSSAALCVLILTQGPAIPGPGRVQRILDLQRENGEGRRHDRDAARC